MSSCCRTHAPQGLGCTTIGVGCTAWQQSVKATAANAWLMRSPFIRPMARTRETLFFYAKLAKMLIEQELAADEWIMQIGWGAGWDSKTFDGALRVDEDEFVKIVNKYDLHLGPGGDRGRQASEFRAGDTFPATRKLMTMAEAGVLRQPPGWVKLKAEAIP